MEPGQVFWYLTSLSERIWSIFPCAYGSRLWMEDDKEVDMWWNRLKSRQQLGLIILVIATVAAIAAALLKNESLAQVAAILVAVGLTLCL